MEQLVAGDVTSGQAAGLEQHLTDCEACRCRLELLVQVPAIERLTELQSAMLHESTSPGLRSAMKCLLLESETLGDPVHFSAKATREVLPQLPASTTPGYLGRLGNIEIRRVIGRGGMGVVFEGLDTILNRTVAVKVLSPHLVADAEAKERFLREARAAAALAQPNIVNIFSIDEADGMPYLVLQFVDGESLDERLKRVTRLPLESLVQMASETARGLAAAHAQGLIHRDIKPANILLENATGISRIADFGLAKLASSDSLSGLGSLAGTPAYMSPEQVEGKTLDGRSDLFSLGVVLYEASTGVSPFAADSPFVVLNNIRELDPKPIRTINADLPEWFAAIVEKLLAKRVESRFQSAEELVDAVASQKVASNQVAGRVRSLTIWTSLAIMAACLVAVLVSSSRGPLPVSPPVSPGPQTPSLQTSVSGFRVDQGHDQYATLAEAIAVASDNSIIEVHGQETIQSDVIVVKGKRLTIRAAANSHPRFVPSANIATGSSQFLVSDSGLRLEGIEILWPIETSPSRLEDTGERCVIAVSGGDLSLDHCRIIAGTQGCCVGCRGRDIEIKNCHLVANSGTGVACPMNNQMRINVEHSLLECRSALFLKPGQNGAQPSINLSRNTFVCERLMTVLTPVQNRRPIRLTATHNIFDSQTLISIVTFGAYPAKERPKSVNLLRETVNWRDESNLYRRGLVYVAIGPKNQALNTLPSSVKSLENWLATFGQPGSKSVEGKIEFEARGEESDTTLLKVASLTELSGPEPPDLGPNLQNVGPR